MRRLLQFGQSVANQFSRIVTDDGRNDKSYYQENHKLDAALVKLQDATNEIIRASTRLQMSLLERVPPDQQMH